MLTDIRLFENDVFTKKTKNTIEKAPIIYIYIFFIYIDIYIYTCMNIYIYTYILYMYIYREKEIPCQLSSLPSQTDAWE